MKIEPGVFLAIIYPEDKTPVSVKKYFTDATRALKESTGNDAQLVHRDLSCICLLIQSNEVREVSRALEMNLDNSVRWMVLRCELPTASFGLSACDTWLNNRLNHR